jgi:hypothetical protein
VADGRLWACPGARGPANVDVHLVKGVHGRDQQGRVMLRDMVVWLGWERRGGEHGEVTRGPAWWCSGQKESNARAGKWWHWC